MKEIKRKVNLAMDAVKDVPEPFKIKAFDVILSNLLGEASQQELPPSIHVEARPTEDSEGLPDEVKSLSKIANMETNQLKDVLHFDENEPVFIGRVEGTEADKQIQISRVLLLVMQEVYGNEWVKGSFLWKALEDYGVGSLSNLAANLANQQAEFRAMGQKKGRKYKLTEQGKQIAIESLRQMAG